MADGVREIWVALQRSCYILLRYRTHGQEGEGVFLEARFRDTKKQVALVAFGARELGDALRECFPELMQRLLRK